MRRQQIEHAAVAVIEVERLAHRNDVHLVRTGHTNGDAEHMLDTKRPVDLVIERGAAP